MSKLELSPREREIVLFLANTGASNQAIADEFHIALQTTKIHLERSKIKIGVHSRGELIVWAWSSKEFEYGSKQGRVWLR